jgi:aldehyde:ferredoxin oxidoreductase
MSEIGIDKPHPSCQVEGTAEVAAKMQTYQTMNDALILCRFTQVGKAVTATNIVDWYNMITGREADIGELMAIGERIFNLKRLFNTRLGVSRKDDFLPPRFLTHNRKGEGITTQLPPMGRLLADYYEYRGWSEEGLPTPEKLRQLGL